MNFVKQAFYKIVWYFAYIFARIIGPIHAPWTHKKTSFKDVCEVMKLLRPGDVLVDRTRGELTTLCIPGFWKHAAVYDGKRNVIEAVNPFVRKNSIVDFIMHTDHVAVLRVKKISIAKGKIIARRAETHLGKKYDYRLSASNTKEVYCSEIAFDSVNFAMGKGYVQLHRVFGAMTITPNDLYNDREKFDLIWEKK